MISLEKLKKYFIKTKQMNAYKFNMLMNKIKRHAAFLNHLAKKYFLPDPRYFHIMALDFIIDQNLEPKLIDIKGSPQFIHKN